MALSEADIEFHKWFLDRYKRLPDKATDRKEEEAFKAAWSICSRKRGEEQGLSMRN